MDDLLSNSFNKRFYLLVVIQHMLNYDKKLGDNMEHVFVVCVLSLRKNGQSNIDQDQIHETLL